MLKTVYISLVFLYSYLNIVTVFCSLFCFWFVSHTILLCSVRCIVHQQEINNLNLLKNGFWQLWTLFHDIGPCKLCGGRGGLALRYWSLAGRELPAAILWITVSLYHPELTSPVLKVPFSLSGPGKMYNGTNVYVVT